ncbi:AAA family ATPase [Stutzerimonas stutzeri]|uniref:AAA family ATPase n=1 Tax=Stutzerimonas stutzeri TaxID=316 RepID=UPI0015E2CEC0|nr:AAA family ATPase [Stutzerimonas stutzeri]MBA1265512.1 AAA family ATPase [Stutzerimonas stutzeri]MBG6333832.1 AAA family ATPase [Pseudomonas aeruginosa]
MQKLERPDKSPAVLRSKAAIQARQQMRDFWALDRQRRAQTSVPAIGLSSTDERLIAAVAAMSLNRCAFCEAKDVLSVHRFRPAGNALPLVETSNAHLYYLWLTDAWQNLLPICTGCIPRETQFPIAGARAPLPSLRQIDAYTERDDGLWPSYPPKETILLLDPVRDRDFEKHLVPKLNGEIIGSSRKGETTVLVFDLNRAERRHQRHQTYQSLIDRLLLLLREGKKLNDSPDWQLIFDFPTIEFGGTWFILLRRIARWIAVSKAVTWQTSSNQIRVFFSRLADGGDAIHHLEAALSAIADEDQGLRASHWAIGSVYTARTSIAAVEISNFKAIEGLQLSLSEPAARPGDPASRRAPSLVILGENATGKSSILEAISLALTTSAARTALNVPWTQMVLDPSQLGLERGNIALPAEVRVKLTNDQSVTLTIEHGSPTVLSELGNHHVPVFAYGAFRRFLTGTRRAAPHKHIRNLFDGSTLSNPEPWLKALKRDQFDMVIRTLRDLLSIEGEFDVIQRERGSRQLRMVTSLTEPDGELRYSRTPLHAVSSGYRSMLAMVCDILRGLLDPQVYEGFESFRTAKGVILIDEIEAHLHPRWKVQVMSSLRNALPGMTFIVTTHDPLCLRGMGEGEVVVLQRIAATDSERASQMPIIVERMMGLPSVADLRIEQLLTSDFFQMLSTDDAAADRSLAGIADLIAARARGDELSLEDIRILSDFECDIASALPVGSSEVHRIVQDTVAEYLRRRRDASSQTLQRLRDDAKAEILAALEAL